MKKIGIFVVAFSIILCCSACVNKDPGSEIIEHPTTETYPPIPYVLYFDSMEQIEEFHEMINKHDNEVSTYLTETGFNMNGICSKEDIAQCFNQIGDVYMLYLTEESGYSLSKIAYNISYGYIMTTYRNGTGFVRCYCFLDTEKASEEKVSLDQELVDTLLVANDEIMLYKANENSLYSLKGELGTLNSRVSIFFSKEATDNDAVNSVRNHLNLTTLNNLIGR